MPCRLECGDWFAELPDSSISSVGVPSNITGGGRFTYFSKHSPPWVGYYVGRELLSRVNLPPVGETGNFVIGSNVVSVSRT